MTTAGYLPFCVNMKLEMCSGHISLSSLFKDNILSKKEVKEEKKKRNVDHDRQRIQKSTESICTFVHVNCLTTEKTALQMQIHCLSLPRLTLPVYKGLKYLMSWLDFHLCEASNWSILLTCVGLHVILSGFGPSHHILSWMAPQPGG